MRRSRCLALLFACAAAIRSQDATALIFGPDDRIEVSTRPGSPYSPIGIVYSSPAGPYVTAFLVGQCELLTVRHSIATKVGNRVQFSVGQIGNSRAWEVSAGTVAAVGDASVIYTDTEVGPGDWALVRLDRCLGKRFGYFELDVLPLLPGEKLAMAGYPGDRSLQNGLTLDPECKIREIAHGMALHDCAMQPGNSGDPLFRKSRNPGRLAVVAINSGGWSYGVPNATLSQPVSGYNAAYANQAIPIEAMQLDSLVGKPKLSRRREIAA